MLRRVAFVGVAWACGTPADPPVEDATTAGGATTLAASSTTSTPGATSLDPSTGALTSGSTTTGSDGPVGDTTTGGGAIECTLGDYRCPAGYGCSQPDFLEPPKCVPIPEGGCTAVEPCPEGSQCYEGSSHSEIGECEPIESSSGASSTGASSSGSSG